MTNLILLISISTNLSLVKLTACHTEPTHLYSIYQSDDANQPITNWDENIIFTGCGTNVIYGHYIGTNRFYLLTDEGIKF